MGGCSKVVYHGVTASVFDCMKKKLEAGGIHVPSGHSGKLSGGGITANFNWDEAAATLSIAITDKPWIYPCGTITGKLHDNVKACGGQ